MSLAFLYPGQGSQRPGMLHALPAAAAVDRTLAEAGAVLGSLEHLDSHDGLADTTNTQLALLIAAVAAARTLTDDHGLIPDIVAGHSVGAFGAAVTTGVLTFGEALSAVRLRGELMRKACAEGDWTMAAIRGLPESAVRRLVETVATTEDPVWIAAINAADQIVLGGTRVGLERADTAACEAGARQFDLLAVSVASHGPIQQRTADRLAEHLAGLPCRRQQVDYVTNTHARRVHQDGPAVLDDVVHAVAVPVRWYDATRLLAELGTHCAVQMPPGHVLTHLLAANGTRILPLALDDAGLERTVMSARRHR